MSDILQAFDALDRLNSWVRSESYPWSSNAKPVVYWLKGEALKWADRMHWSTHRGIEVAVKCRSCNGTGIWRRHGWIEIECNRCKRGCQLLRFIETTIMDHWRWHTPAYHGGPISDILPTWDRLHCTFRDDWQPNQKGKDMPPHEVARAFNLVEQTVPCGEFQRRWNYDYDEINPDYSQEYRLYLGEVRPKCCPLCSSPRVNGGVLWQQGKGRIVWHVSVCSGCERSLRHNADVRLQAERWLELRPPENIIDPDIARWIALHPVVPAEVRETSGVRW